MAEYFSPPLGVSSPLPLALTQGGTGLTVPPWLATSRANGANRAGISSRFKEWQCGFTGTEPYDTLAVQLGAVADAGIKGGGLAITTGATNGGIIRVKPVGAIKLTTNHKTERWHMHARLKLTGNPGTNDGNLIIGWIGGGAGILNYNGAGGDATYLVFYDGVTFTPTTATIAALKAAYQDVDIDYNGTTATIRVDDVIVGTSANTNFGAGSYSPAIDFEGANGGAQTAIYSEVHVQVNGQ